MKKKYFNIMLMAALAVASASCTDFLTEENKTGETADLAYQTETGIAGLANSAYAYTRGWWGKEAALGLSECAGTDLFFIGGDNQQKSLAKYDITPYTSTNNKDNACLDEYWELFYAGIDVANNLLKYSAGCNAISEKQKYIYQADAYFLRALYYAQLVATYGPVPYNADVISASSNTAVRVPEREIYKHILDDLKLAMEMYNSDKGGVMSTKDAVEGHGSYYAAKALYAREALYAASWLGANSVEGYGNLYTEALNASKEVISYYNATSGLGFYENNFMRTWNMVDESGNNNEDAKSNKECIYAVHYSNTLEANFDNCVPYRFTTDGDSRGQYSSLITRLGYTKNGGSASLLMFVSKWDNNNTYDFGKNKIFVRVSSTTKTLKDKDGNSVDIAKYYSPYGRGFRRWLPSLYLWQELEKIKDTDSRYNGTMLTHYNIPQALASMASNYPNMGNQEFKNYDEAYKEDGNYFNGGGYAIRYSILDGDSPEGQQLQAEAKNKYRLQFAYGGDIPIYSSGKLNEAVPTSEAKVVSDVYGDERYNNAEIGGRSTFPGIKKFLDTEYNEKYPTYEISSRDFMVLRLAEMYLIKAEAEMETGATTDAESTINELREVRKIAGLPSGANSLANAYSDYGGMTIDVILRERAIELCGEYQRWFDLKRTHKLLEYVKARNYESAQNIQLKHYYRPIPDTELTAVTNKIDTPCSQDANGVLQYTTTADGMWQNPGY